MATKKIHIPSHHGQMIDLAGSADVAPIEPQTTDMSLNDQQRAAIGAGAGDYQFDLSGAANLSWSDWHSTALPKKKTAPVIAQVPTVGLYNANPYRSGEDAAQQAGVLQQQQTDPSMVEAFKTGWRQTIESPASVSFIPGAFATPYITAWTRRLPRTIAPIVQTIDSETMATASRRQ